MLVFEQRGKPEYLEKNLLEQGREPTTNSTHIIMTLGLGIKPGRHWWEVSALTTAPSLLPCSFSDLNILNCLKNDTTLHIHQVEDHTVHVPCPNSFVTVLVFPTAGFPVKKILYDTVSTASCGGKLGASSIPGSQYIVADTSD